MEKRAFGIWLVGASVALALMACGDEPAGNQVGSLPRVDTTRPAGTGGETPDATDPAEDVASSGVGADAEQDAGPVDTPSPVAAGSIGAACQQAGDCDGVDAVCLDLPGGYCVLANCTEGSCPEGSACFAFEGGEDYCIQTCQSQEECRVADGYVCDADATCWPGSVSAGASPVGGPCTSDADCADADATCYGESFQGSPTGFINGYCMIWSCSDGSCPEGATCLTVTSDGGAACFADCSASACPQALGYQCSAESATCWPGCDGDAGCPPGTACHPELGYCVTGWSNTPFECIDTTFEPNESMGQPGMISGEGSWDALQICSEDVDWYAITIPKGHLGTVGATFQHALGDLDLLAYDGQGGFLGSRLWVEDYGAASRGNENNYEFLSIMNLNGDAQGYFKVRPFAGADNNYDFEVMTTPWQDDLLCTDHFGFDACRGYDGTSQGELYQFPFPDPADPYVGDGYLFDSYGSYRWLRRELIMLVRYAIHETQIRFSGTHPLGLIDMCDKDGVTPGYDVGDPRHPETTHDQGGNIDIAYYQSDGNSSAEAVCGPNNSDTDGYFCTSVDNHIMDVSRVTYFMAMINRHPRLRVIGVDKLLAPLIQTEALAQYQAGYFSAETYQSLLSTMAYGDGWPFHHHHMHVSMRWWSEDSAMPGAVMAAPTQVDGCGFRMPGDGT